MATTKFRERKTPGVYVTELDAFPPSIIGVQTAVPAFIGYTEKALVNGKSVLMQPIKIESLVDYEQFFGKGFEPKFNIVAATGADFDIEVDVDGTLNRYQLEPVSKSKFYLYYSMRLFFDNGGGTCYIVSVGDYTDNGATPGGVEVSAANLESGLKAIADEIGPTMLVIPDAALLPKSGDGDLPNTSGMPFSEDFPKVVRSMLKQSMDLQDRVAILDVYGAQALNPQDPQYSGDLDALIQQFHVDVGDLGLNYGMGYFPFLKTSVVEPNEIEFTNIDSLGELKTILSAEAKNLYSGNNQKYTTVEGYIGQISEVDPLDLAAVAALDQNLTNALPVLKQIEQTIAKLIGILPPSGAMAGLYALNDQTRGVWNAPANYSLNAVLAPTVNLNDEEQGDLNVPLDGKAVNAIRSFPGRGTIVWGARTLDGNSNDWRYIQVRRAIMYMEQSIKNALDQYVFAPNDGNTWVRVVASISNFLQGVWAQGGLMGATASEAFTVECGLGTTMTAQDILEGYMIVQVVLQMIRPAEFIELTFQQKMEG